MGVQQAVSSFHDFNRNLIDDLRAHGGKATSGPFLGRDVLILTTKGAKSGEKRENPLVYTRRGDHYVIVASKGGAPTHPSWYHNLLEHPDVTVHLEFQHPDRVYEKVLKGTADFGLVSFPRRMRELIAMPWREEEMVLACSPRHPLARHLLISPGELAGEKYIGFDKGLVIRKEVDRFLREQGVAVEVALEFDNIENIKKAVESDLGIALLPEPTLRREVRDRTLAAVPLLGCRLGRPLGIIQRRHHTLSSAALSFLKLLREPEGNGSSTDGGAAKHKNGGRPQVRSDAAARTRNGAPKDKLKSTK